jgi:hypothetical protein
MEPILSTTKNEIRSTYSGPTIKKVISSDLFYFLMVAYWLLISTAITLNSYVV